MKHWHLALALVCFGSTASAANWSKRKPKVEAKVEAKVEKAEVKKAEVKKEKIKVKAKAKVEAKAIPNDDDISTPNLSGLPAWKRAQINK